jgi:hypothetical protein
MPGIVDAEQWRAIPGWEGFYEVSDQGRVRSLDRWVNCSHGVKRHRGRVLSPRKHPGGYTAVQLSREGVTTQWLVHRLVMLAFEGPCPEGLEVAHQDGIKTDNRLSRLRYDTPRGNNADKIEHGTHREGERMHHAKLTPDNVREVMANSPSTEAARALAEKFDYDSGNIWKIWRGETWRSVTELPAP